MGAKKSSSLPSFPGGLQLLTLRMAANRSAVGFCACPIATNNSTSEENREIPVEILASATSQFSTFVWSTAQPRSEGTVRAIDAGRMLLLGLSDY